MNKTTASSFRLNPWVLFVIFLAANSLLSYAGLPLQAQLWVGLLGLVLPFGLAFTQARSADPIFKKSESFDQKCFDPPAALWILFFFLLILTRFYRFTTLPVWPLADEAQIGLLGIDQARHWHGNLLWCATRVEPMIFWVMGLYFKLFEPSFFSLRLLPALFSIAVPLAGYWAARQCFSKLTSFLFAWLMAFSFGELTLSRFLSTVMLVPLFQCLVLVFLGKLLSQAKPAWKTLIGLSLLAGIGFYTWTNWISVWLAIAAVLFFYFFLEKPKNAGGFALFTLVTLAVILPLIFARLEPGGMNHITQVGGFPSWRILFLYLRGIFWDGLSSFPYGSNWGGIFNPILDSLLLMGILYLLQTANRKWILFVSACAFFPLLLAALTWSVELYRILPLLTLFTFLAALGIRALMPGGSRLRSLGVIALCLFGSFGLDADNFIFHYSDFQNNPGAQKWRSLEHLHAFQIMEKLSEQTGPLYVFSEFLTDYDDRTLNIVDYPIDALQNPRLSQSHPQWAVLLDHIDYAPYLMKRFPGMKYEQLAKDNSLGLFLIPAAQIAPGDLKAWIEADRVYRQVDLNIKNKNPLFPWGKFTEQFAGLKSFDTGDRFLNSVFWEKTASFKVMAGNFIDAAKAYGKASQTGYPAAHLRYDAALAAKLVGKLN